MSERQLNIKEPIQKNEPVEEAQECDEKKVGNLEQFKKVKSNSGFKVFCLIVFMFSFVIIYVLINFAVYIPMFNNIEIITVERDMIIH